MVVQSFHTIFLGISECGPLRNDRAGMLRETRKRGLEGVTSFRLSRLEEIKYGYEFLHSYGRAEQLRHRAQNAG